MLLCAVMTVVPLCAMENTKKNAGNDEEVFLAQKKAFGLEVKQRVLIEYDFLRYPKDSDITINLDALNEELGLSNISKVSRYGDLFVVPAGMDKKFIHKTLVPQRISDFEVELEDSEEEF